MMAGHIETDVLVVGLGPAGAAAALGARGHGVRVLAIDRRPVPGVPMQCAELVPALAVQDSAAVRAAAVQPIARMLTWVEAEAADECTPFPGYMLDRARFDQLQVEAARSAGADCRPGVALVGIAADGLVQATAGLSIAARVIVGADGPWSRVGRWMGQRNQLLVHARQLTLPLRVAHDATDIYLSAGIAGGYGWLFPRGARANVGVGVMAPARRRLRSLLDGLHARLRAEGRVGAEVLAVTGGAIPVNGMLTPYASTRRGLCLLAGDAAGLTNPVTGAGIHAALMSGRLAGEAAAAWLDGRRSAGADYASELADTLGPSLAHALHHRRRMQSCWQRQQRPGTDELRRGWIAYPDYWQRERPAPVTAREVCA